MDDGYSKEYSKEYRDLLDAIETRGKYRNDGKEAGELYHSLMKRERRVLDTVDRIVNDDKRRRSEASSFLNMPLHRIGIKIVAVVRGVMDDLINVRNLEDLKKIIRSTERKIYFGIFIILVAILALIID